MNGKAPGPNGLTAEIIRYNWDTCKEDIMGAILFFFLHKYMHKGLNHTHVTLTPRKQGSISLCNFCLIACVGMIYKITSKLLAKRLEATLPKLISENQFFFKREVHL